MIMKTTPILFSTEMVQAILADNKTQTRRIVKFNKEAAYELLNGAEFELTRMQNGYKDGVRPVFGTDDEPNEFSVINPYGKPGEILWVREEHYPYGHWIENGKTKKGRQKWKFIATSDEVLYFDTVGVETRVMKNSYRKEGWYQRLARFMPKAACRLFLKIKSIRVERLQDINEADAIAEGVEKWLDGNYKAYTKEAGKFIHARDSYRTLWQKINGSESWDANPYVWVVEFEKTDKPNGF